MSKHTPGPWFFDDMGSIWRRPISDLYEYGGNVALDKPLAAAFIGWHKPGEIGYPKEANARLIAAAPDLLEALEDLIRYTALFAAHLEDSGYFETEHLLGIATGKARAAIRKARGETE